MKKLLCFILAACVLLTPASAFAADSVGIGTVEAVYDMSITPTCDAETIEVGDQFLVEFTLGNVKPYLTYQLDGSFDASVAQIVAPVYTNESMGILLNEFDNEKGTFTFVAYDQQIRGVNSEVICSLLCKAIAPGEFKIAFSDETMIGKAGENAFYNLEKNEKVFNITEDTDESNVSIIEDPEPLTPFDDLLYYDWAENAIAVMYDLGVLEDIADTSYRPGENITRGDFITMLVRVCKLKAAGEAEPFNDVDEESYAYEPIMIAKSRNIAKGDADNNFNPDAYITREDICALVFRTMLNMNKADSNIDADKYLATFSDSGEIYPYAIDSVAGLIRAKLIIGDNSGLIRPKDNMTRAEVAVMLNRLAEYNILISR